MDTDNIPAETLIAKQQKELSDALLRAQIAEIRVDILKARVRELEAASTELPTPVV